MCNVAERERERERESDDHIMCNVAVRNLCVILYTHIIGTHIFVALSL